MFLNWLQSGIHDVEKDIHFTGASTNERNNALPLIDINGVMGLTGGGFILGFTYSQSELHRN